MPVVGTILKRKAYTVAEEGQSEDSPLVNRRQLEIAAFDSNGTPGAASHVIGSLACARCPSTDRGQLVPLTKTDRRVVTNMALSRKSPLSHDARSPGAKLDGYTQPWWQSVFRLEPHCAVAVHS